MKYKLLVLSFVTAVTVSAFAEAPVVDLSQTDAAQTVAQPSTQSSPTVNAVEISPTDAAATTVSPTNVNTPAQSSLTDSQRLARLEQQVGNIAGMNLPQQISELQQQLAQLRGQLQVQEHDLKLLNDQQRNFYQDLDQRISQLKSLSGTATDHSSNPPPVKSSVNTPVSDSSGNGLQLKDSNAYRSAFNLITQKKYDEAETAFQNYLNNYPKGDYAANAHYWLGEIYVQQKNNKNAVQEFNTVITQYPQSAKAADAKLKLAVIHADSGDIAQARRELMQIKKQHPGSTAAQLASIRLQQLDSATKSSNTKTQ